MSDYQCNACGQQPCGNPKFCKLCRRLDNRATNQPKNKDIERLRDYLSSRHSLDRIYDLMQRHALTRS